MPTELDEISREIKRKLDDLVDALKGLDMDREAVNLLKETENGLDALSRTIERKRREMDEKGVERTVRKDAARVLDSLAKTLNEVKEDLDPDKK